MASLTSERSSATLAARTAWSRRWFALTVNSSYGAVAASHGAVPLLRALHDVGLIPRSVRIEDSVSQFRSRGTTDE